MNISDLTHKSSGEIQVQTRLLLMGEPDLGLDSRAHIIASEIQIQTRPLLFGEPDPGLGCLAMVGNNKL